jgi:hypothetical protein
MISPINMRTKERNAKIDGMIEKMVLHEQTIDDPTNETLYE